MNEVIGIGEVTRIIGKSEFTIRQYIKKRNFPKPHYIDETIGGIKTRVRAWYKHDIVKWKDSNKHWL